MPHAGKNDRNAAARLRIPPFYHLPAHKRNGGGSVTDAPLEIIRGWISTASLVGLLGFAGRMWMQNRRLEMENRALGMQAKVEDRQGYGDLLTAMRAEIERLRGRVETLEKHRDGEHQLIVQLIGQTNRTQALEIVARADISPELRRAMESTISGTDTTQ